MWHFGVAPRVPAAELRFVPQAVVAPWREAHALPTTERTVSPRGAWG